MKIFKAGWIMALSSLLFGAQSLAAVQMVMPMTVSPDKRFLIAGIRTKPFTAQTYSIDRATSSPRPTTASSTC